ncbi:hypothetical protein MHYP_G00062220 [Metynnis hypsauchen]
MFNDNDRYSIIEISARPQFGSAWACLWVIVGHWVNMPKLDVGNLSSSVTVEDLQRLFRQRKLPKAHQV